MIKNASSQKLKDAFESQMRETQNQVEQLKQVFRIHRREPEAIDCPAIDGIIEEANEVSGEVADDSVLDAALIASAQAVEH
jgi:ferritin-like metal-binding protein YciE